MSQPEHLDNNKTTALAQKAAISVAVGVGAAMLPGIALYAAGFSGGGVIPGSMAGMWQSSIGNVVAGSLFAGCQSVGAAGFSLSTMAAIGTAGFIGTNARGCVHGNKLLGSMATNETVGFVGKNGTLLVNGTVQGINLIGSGVSTSSKFVYDGSVQGIHLIGTGISSSSKYVHGFVRSKL